MLKPRSGEPWTEIYIFPFGSSSEPRAHGDPAVCVNDTSWSGGQWYRPLTSFSSVGFPCLVTVFTAHTITSGHSPFITLIGGSRAD